MKKLTVVEVQNVLKISKNFKNSNLHYFERFELSKLQEKLILEEKDHNFSKVSKRLFHEKILFRAIDEKEILGETSLNMFLLVTEYDKYSKILYAQIDLEDDNGNIIAKARVEFELETLTSDETWKKISGSLINTSKEFVIPE